MAKKILLIEDEELIYSLLQKKLTQAGYDVTVAINGDEGLTKMREIKPDLILLDIIMPQKDGFSVMEEIQKDKELQRIPIIVISNSGQPVELNRAKELGAKDWLIKTDFDPNEVLEKVKKYI
jgi:two-component system alkaline phosphatase synthesis response regulator PhoP